MTCARRWHVSSLERSGQRRVGAFGHCIAAYGASIPCRDILRYCYIDTSSRIVDGKGAAVKRCCHISPRLAALGAAEVWSSRNIDLVYTWTNEHDFLFEPTPDPPGRQGNETVVELASAR